MKHLDWCTHIQFLEDRDILTRRSFDVNMRLFHQNLSYQNIIKQCCAHIEFSAIEKKEGYKKPHGWSGANAGIPFNIISVLDEAEFPLTMINPRIVWCGGDLNEVYTNCGSLTLEVPRKVFRWEFIDVEFFDIEGNKQRLTAVPKVPGYTIQHEIDHTQGCLINANSG